MVNQSDKYKIGFIYLALTTAALAVFWQVRNFEFTNYDDDKYVSENSHIATGLKCDNVVWVFTHQHYGNWHPLTGLSHILDCQLFGANAGEHHGVSLLFHIANTLLLFTVLRRMTGTIWQSAFVAALFAIHPLHVESVAWLSERKDVLSTFFWILTMWAYVRYVRNPSIGNYALTVVLFAFGLMSKPMVITLPFVLLLLDYWPLERLEGKTLYNRLLEKIPLFILAAISSVIAFLSQRSAGAVREIDVVPLTTRAANAVISYVKYIEKLFVPTHLAAFYPYHEKSPPLWQWLAAAALLLFITILVIRLASKFKYLPVGWFWYLGTLLPVIGIVLVGHEAMADRYTYVPLTGLFIIIAWAANDWLKGWKYRKISLGLSSFVIISVLSVCAWFQTSYWRTSQSLFEHALKVTDKNYLAHNNLGLVLLQQNKINEAIDQLRLSLLSKPDYVEAMNNLDFIYNRLTISQEALKASGQASEISLQYAEAYCNLARAYNDLNRPQQSIAACTKALEISPDFANAYCNLGVAYGELNKPLDAVEAFKHAVKIKPGMMEACYNLGTIYMQLGQIQDAITAFKQALKVNPSFTAAHLGLGISYIKAGEKDAALKECEVLKSLDAEKADKLYGLIYR